jgi:DUF1009 family protein
MTQIANKVKALQGGGVLAIEANKTLVLDQEKLVEWANAEKICIVGVDSEGHYK